VIVTVTSDEVPFAFVACTVKVYVPAVLGVKAILDKAVAVAGAGVCVKPGAGRGNTGRGNVRVQANLGAGTELLVAVIVTGVFTLTVCAAIGLIVGAGAF
jgi:hypothetical protein